VEGDVGRVGDDAAHDVHHLALADAVHNGLLMLADRNI
jgi:hypothetical protein